MATKVRDWQQTDGRIRITEGGGDMKPICDKR
jgi:hypothetical protein